MTQKPSRSFARFSRAISQAAGSAPAFGLALLGLIVWLISGPFFHFNDTWQLIVNTATTVITFLMVFLIQGSQNHDTESLQIKLNELIRAIPDADNELIDLEEADNEELKAIHQRYLKRAEHVSRALERRAGTSR